MGAWVAATLLMLAIPLAIYAVWFVLLTVVAGGFSSGQRHENISDAMGVVIFISLFIMMLLLWLASTLMMGGMFRMAVRQVRGELISAGDIFSTVDTLPALLGSSIIIAFVACLGAVLCLIPGYIVQGILMLTHPLVVDQRLGALEAVSRSWEALKEEMLMATLFHFVLALAASLGIFLCGIGILFTFPLLPLGIAIVYRDFFMTPVYGANAYTPPPTAPLPPPPPTTPNDLDYEE